MPILTENDENLERAIKVIGRAYHKMVTAYGFVPVDVGVSHIVYTNADGYQVTLYEHRRFCKHPFENKGFEVYGFIDLEAVISGDGRFA